MDMDFAVSCPLVRRWRLVSGFCPSTRTFVPCFLQTPPRGDSPCIITRPYLHQVGRRTFTSELLSMPSTQRSRWRGGRLRVSWASSLEGVDLRWLAEEGGISVTHLRKIMLEELHRRNYAQTTIDCYVRTVEHFSRYFQRSPEQLGPQHIREYQAALFKQWKLAPNTVNQRLAALRFFYIQTLKRAWSVAETPYPKKVLKLPIILSQEEVARLINSALTPFHRIVLMTLSATGVRPQGVGMDVFLLQASASGDLAAGLTRR